MFNLLTAEGNVEQTHALAIRIGLILEKSEQERAFSRRWSRVAAIKVPQQRLAGLFCLRIAFPTPHRPDLRIIARDAFARGQDRLEHGEDLQSGAAVELASAGKKRPKIDPPL